MNCIFLRRGYGETSGSKKLVIYETGKAEIQNGTVTIDSYNDYATFTVGTDKLSINLDGSVKVKAGNLYIDGIDLTKYTKFVATGYVGTGIEAYLFGGDDTVHSGDFTIGSLTTMSLDISSFSGETRLAVYFYQQTANIDFNMYFTDIHLE